MKNLKATKGSGTAHHPHSSVAMNETADGADRSQPRDERSEQDHEDATILETPEDAHSSTHRAMPVTDKEAKQRHADEQVGFIILKRDNNKPDAYGAVSETYGPLPWPAVAKAYNEKYEVSVGPAAMEKRVRQHRGAWVAKHPTYPLNIVYAKKPKKQQAARSKVIAVEHEPCRTNGNAEKQQVCRPNEACSADESQMHAEPIERHISNDRIGGWVPPDIIRNRADLKRYVDLIRSAHEGKVVIDVIDAQGLLFGTVMVDREGLLRSSILFQRLMDKSDQAQVELQYSSFAVIQRYVQCISSEGLTELPAYSHCDGSSLMELYCFAAQLQDDHVRGLIWAMWRHLGETDAEMGLAIEDLNLLFESTQNEDPARRFWIDTIHTAGLAHKLVEMDGCSMELIHEIRKMAAIRSV
jgi:hypothetical protein